MKFTLGIILSFFCSQILFGQSKANAAYLELGKNGLIINLFYDHKVSDKKIGFRAGIGYSPGRFIDAYSGGAGGFALIGNRNHFFELGLDLSYLVIERSTNDQRGLQLIYPDYSIKTYYLSVNAGYRYYGNKNIFRIGLSPGTMKGYNLLGGYLSYGITF